MSMQDNTSYQDSYDKLKSLPGVSKTVYSLYIHTLYSSESYLVKWQEKLYTNILLDQYTVLFRNIYQFTISTKLRDFQYRLLLYKLVTNRHLKNWKIRTDDKCSFWLIWFVN